MPKISVIMPVYNGEQYLHEAIDSILAQTYTDFEFIILDDGSTDSSADIVRSYEDPRILFVQNERNMGVAATLNRGLDLATGEYIARMDADDISLPERFEKQMEYMDAHPNMAVCGSAIRLFGAKWGERCFASDPAQMKVDMFFSCGLAHPSVMLRGSVFGANGLRYDDHFSKMEDYALWLKAMEQHDIVCIPDVLLKYRIHPNQITQHFSPEAGEQARELKEIQLRQIQAPLNGDGHEAFLKYCEGAQSLTQEKTAQVISYLRKIKDANKASGRYDALRFGQSLDAVGRRLLDALPVGTAVRVVHAAGESGIAYAAKRVLRGRRAAFMNAVSVQRKRSHLRHRDFTIISNNCWGGMVYRKYGLKYNTPTAGLYIPGDDFVRFCADWQTYITQELRFIPWEESRLYPQIKNSAPYPVARFGDVEVYFMHYSSPLEAQEKWERRKSRINPERMVFKLSQRECCAREDVERFLSLPLKNKLCFAYDDVPGAIVIPELRDLVGDETPLIEQYFDELDYLNRL